MQQATNTNVRGAKNVNQTRGFVRMDGDLPLVAFQSHHVIIISLAGNVNWYLQTDKGKVA